MIWIVIFLIIAGTALGIFLLAKLLVSHAKEYEEHQKGEDFFAKFSYTDDEWDSLYQSEFVEDQRGRGFIDKYVDVISLGKTGTDDGEKYIRFSDRAIYLVGGGELKSFSVNRLNLNGDGTHLVSIRLLQHSPLDKLQVKVKVNIDLVDYRAKHDLDYLVPLPRSVAAEINDILSRYAG
jgi:hypothetical protein